MNAIGDMTRPSPVIDYAGRQAALAAEYLERARSIAPLVEREAEATEQASGITKPVHEAFVVNNLYWMMLPEELGGPGLGGKGGFEVIEEVCRADGSTGWSLMANAFNNALTAGFISEEGVQLMYGGKDKAITCGQFAAVGTAVVADGGLIGKGRFQFGSGSAHADWIGGGVTVMENGKPRMLDNGWPDTRVIHMPISKAEMRGNWDVIGLLGTSSFDYEIPEQFVPDHLVMNGAWANTPLRGGPFYHFGWFGSGAVGHAAIVCGITKRALQEVAAVVHDKQRLGYSVPAHEHPVFKHQFSCHEAAWRSARLLALAAIDEAESAVVSGEGIQPIHFARLRQACSWTHKVAVEAVQFCHHWSASRSFRNPTVLGRCTRDMAVATQHVIADETAFSDHAGPIYDSWLEKGG